MSYSIIYQIMNFIATLLGDILGGIFSIFGERLQILGSKIAYWLLGLSEFPVRLLQDLAYMGDFPIDLYYIIVMINNAVERLLPIISILAIILSIVAIILSIKALVSKKSGKADKATKETASEEALKEETAS